MTYQTANRLLEGRATKKLANNTYLERDVNNTISVRLHSTNVLIFLSNGTILVNTGGWETHTTKDRINRFLPAPFSVYQKKGNWFWSGHNCFGETPFTNGDVIKNGRLYPLNLPKDPTKP